jgi:hypothetical protein
LEGVCQPLLPIFFNYCGVRVVEVTNFTAGTAGNIFQCFVSIVSAGLAGVPVMVGEFVSLYIVAPVEVKVVAFFVGVIQQASAGVSFIGVVRAVNCVYGAMVMSHRAFSFSVFLSIV